MSQEEQDCTKSLKEALSSSDKLNISVVGNIDSGKSLLENTLCEYLGDDAEHQSSERKAQGDRPLSIFAGEMLILSLIESMQPQRKNVRVTNKSLDSVYYDTVLLKSYALELTKNEFDYLTELYLTAKRAVTNPVNLIVWVDIDPKRCFDKCLAENTKDHAPPLFFFQMLDNLYRSWLASDSNNVPVVRIDGNVSWDEFNTSVVQFCTTVRKFVDERKNKIFVSQ